MTWFIRFVIVVVSMILAEFLRPDPEVKDTKPKALSDFDLPTASQSRRIPVFWGKPIHKAPNVTWYGHLRTEPVIETVKYKKGFKTRKKRYVVGHKYFLGMHLCFAVGDDNVELLKILVDDKLAWTGNVHQGSAYINKPQMFGGEKEGGGVQGWFDFYPGSTHQPINDYLKFQVGSQCPAFRGVASLVWRQGYLGTSEYPKPWSAQLRRVPNTVSGAYANVDGQANPAEVIYEIITNPEWGMGLPFSLIEIPTFVHCAKQLHAENFGVSMIWDQGKKLGTIMEDVKKVIDGLVYINARTGRFEMKLLRGDYDLSQVPKFDESNIVEIEKFGRPTHEETVNEVKVVWTDLDQQQERIVQVQDLGGYFAKKEQFVSAEISYSMVTNQALAIQLATRDLRTLSYPLANLSMKVNRDGFKLVPGDYFSFSWYKYGIKEMPMVVIEIDYGTLEDREITVEAIQDVFKLGEGLYTPTPPSEWVPVESNPEPVTDVKVIEVPYWINLVIEDQENVNVISPMIMAKAPGGTALSYSVLYSEGMSSFIMDTEDQAFTPSGRLVQPYEFTEGVDTTGDMIIDRVIGFDPTDAEDADIRDHGFNVAMIDDEFIALKTIESLGEGRFKIKEAWRGLLDTVMQRHQAGATVWFPTEAYGTTTKEYTRSVPLRYKLLSRGATGTLPASMAPAISFNPVKRFNKPYPVTNVRINGKADPKFTGNTITITFKWRNRLSQEKILNAADASVSPEADSFVRISLYDDYGSLIHESPDLTDVTAYTHELEEPSPESLKLVVTTSRSTTTAMYSEIRYLQKIGSGEAATDLSKLSGEFALKGYWRLSE